jgi:hypothetical protein
MKSGGRSCFDRANAQATGETARRVNVPFWPILLQNYFGDQNAQH